MHTPPFIQKKRCVVPSQIAVFSQESNFNADCNNNKSDETFPWLVPTEQFMRFHKGNLFTYLEKIKDNSDLPPPVDRVLLQL